MFTMCAFCKDIQTKKKDGIGNRMACAGCLAVFYCGRQCQKDGWKAGHKQECKLLKNASECKKLLPSYELFQKTGKS